MENTTKAPPSSTPRIQAALLGPNAVLEEEGMIENPEVVGMHIGGMVDISQLPSSITVNAFNAAVTGAINNPTIIGVNIEQHMPSPPFQLPKQTVANNVPYYISTSYETKLHEYLQAQQHDIKKMAIYGITGSGKTVLAMNYYREQCKQYQISQMLYAEIHSQWQQCLRVFAERVSPGLNAALKMLSEAEQHNQLIAAIQEELEKNSWCIFIDNWDEKTGPKWVDINRIFNRGNGLLLITTQHQSPFHEKNCSLDLSRGSNKEADLAVYTLESCMLINKILETLEDKMSLGSQSDLENLAKTLNHLPLALSQAACYILWENNDRQRQGRPLFTYNDYQNLLETETNLLLKTYAAVLTENRDYVPQDAESTHPDFRRLKTQEAAVRLSIKKAIEGPDNKPLLQLLCFCGFIASEGISQQLLKNYLQEILDDPSITLSDEKFYEIIGAAQNYSLLQYEGNISSIDNLNTLHIHRVIQKVLREIFQIRVIPNSTDLLFVKAVPALEKLLMSQKNNSKYSLPIRREFLSHGRQLYNHIIALLPIESLRECEWYGHLLLLLGKTENVLVQYNIAEEHLKAALNFHGKTSLKVVVVNIHMVLGNILADTGRCDDALNEYRLAEDICKELSDEAISVFDRSYYLSMCYLNIGAIFAERKQFDEAKIYFASSIDLFPSDDKVEVPHEDLAMAHNNLGHVLLCLGDDRCVNSLRKSLRLYELIGEKTALGSVPDILEPLNNLGEAYQKMGLYFAARDQYTKARRVYKAHCPSNEPHPKWADTLHNLGALSIKCGDNYGDRESYEDAYNDYNKSYNMKVSLYSGNHASIAKTLKDLGICEERLENNAAANNTYIKARDMYQVLNNQQDLKIYDADINELDVMINKLSLEEELTIQTSYNNTIK